MGSDPSGNDYRSDIRSGCTPRNSVGQQVAWGIMDSKHYGKHLAKIIYSLND